MDDIQKIENTELQPAENQDSIKLEIIEEGIRKKYLARLTEMQIAPVGAIKPLETDIIDNIRVYKITEMVYRKGEPAIDKFTTVFNTLSTYNSTVFIVIDSDGRKTDFYIGVRNNEKNEKLKRSTVTLGDTLKNTLIGHFPGIKIVNEDRKEVAEICNRITAQHNVTSVSVVGNKKINGNSENEQFIQGLEKLALAMYGRQYMGIILASSQSPQTVEILRKGYQQLYTDISPLQKIQYSDSTSFSKSKSQSFFEMDGKQKAAMIASLAASSVGMMAGAAVGGATDFAGGAMLGGEVAGHFAGFLNSLAPVEQHSEQTGSSTSRTTENKAVTDLLELIDACIKRTNEFDSYGMWNAAAYFVSDDMSTAEIAASNYRSLMNGDNSGREVSAINSWRSNNKYINGNFTDLTKYLSRFVHPRFFYSENGAVTVNAATAISGKELGLHLGLPRATVPGLPVIEHAEFGKEVTAYRLFAKNSSLRPEDRMTLGKIFDLGQITNKPVELDNKSLNMHTFITGSTGAGKSNTVYQILCELHQDKIPFLVVEPAKGEYKDVFGNWPDVNVFSTNPKISELININPFKFPESIHVLEHVDGLVGIFSACWPMYDAMPAFFKDAILKSYEKVGWDIGSSVFEGKDIDYPDFEILADELERLIQDTDYSAEVKGNYTGALVTRVKSLTVGLNKYIFTSEQTPYKKMFDENCILDISRVKSTETKALIMGLTVYILNEYRIDRKTGSNSGLRHVTVLEEAHNLLKNTSGGESDLVSKSIEMITNTIAEIRTYGEGFVIVDQSPSSVDIAAIKNTNTKIVLRTPEANDRDAVGRSMGLTPDQVNEIAKLPSGVAVVYQNDWINPVLTMIDKANVSEQPYEYKPTLEIKSIKQSRTLIIRAIMQPWLPGEVIRFKELALALSSVDVSREHRKLLSVMLYTYSKHGGHILWNENSIDILRELLFDLLSISQNSYNEFKKNNNAKALMQAVSGKTRDFTVKEINEICHIITKEN